MPGRGRAPRTLHTPNPAPQAPKRNMKKPCPESVAFTIVFNMRYTSVEMSAFWLCLEEFLS
ncbi:hypothetical protein KDA_15880 [Dictyobacter alpinus]|uniref:Uncharacterized protein n=1 Tax=Dictyobacter alpinus TaxID=2014873 RepID=A0A402B409_9CHLR|nr:hypothetical protein KDA_15880 [Dictyobacter alpinus]